MNVLSTFDGIACGLQALKNLGIEVTNYYASEVDKYAMKVAKDNHPEIVHIGDVRNVRIKDLPFIPDLVLGGSPCQGFSFAGKQLNFDDPRSMLFFEYARLLKEATITQRVNGEIKTETFNINLPDGSYGLRKLSTIECERLQGLPDGYTSCISNSQAYKALGNGWNVQTIEHILKTVDSI